MNSEEVLRLRRFYAILHIGGEYIYGKEFEFKILKIDAEGKRVSIGYKQLQPKPWDCVAEKYNVGDVVKGKVVRIIPIGAFVELGGGKDGMVHISEVCDRKLKHPSEVLKVGDVVKVWVLSVDISKKRIGLTMKQPKSS